ERKTESGERFVRLPSETVTPIVDSEKPEPLRLAMPTMQQTDSMQRLQPPDDNDDPSRPPSEQGAPKALRPRDRFVPKGPITA
ncbi:MAG TPA: hypothetical protein VEF76_06235, partial [Patescibacteria group bacterium]|nr:hypothetical protein [Patescibacteria group bacterium]